MKARHERYMSTVPTKPRGVEWRYLRDVLRVLVARDMMLRYKRSVLGLLWTLVNPLSQLLVLHFVFSRLLAVKVEDFLVFLFIGIISWNWFHGALLQATVAVVENRELIRRPGFPSAILPAVTIASHLVHFLLTLPILLALLLWQGLPLGASLIALPAVILIQFGLTLGLSYFVATFHVLFRDTQYLLGIALMLGFYLTPIFYSLDAIPEGARQYYSLNPMAHLIGSYRAIFIAGSPPSLQSLLVLGAVSTTLGIAGFALFRANSHRFAEEL